MSHLSPGEGGVGGVRGGRGGSALVGAEEGVGPGREVVMAGGLGRVAGAHLVLAALAQRTCCTS